MSSTSSEARIGTATCADPRSFIPFAGRIALAAIFALSGLSKIMAPSATLTYISSAGLPFPQLALVIAVMIELGGGIALIAGYRTRLTASILALFTIVTAFAFHAHFGDQNQFIHFFKNIAMAGGLLQVVAFGAGGFSVDANR